MPHLKKSQAALEFIMTYGWAILVVLVAIGALAYFGVLSPDKFLPNKCQLQAGLACIDHTVVDQFGPGNGYIAIAITNSLGYDMINVQVAATGCTSGGSEGIIKNGEDSITLLATGCTLTSGQKYSGDFNITYTNAETLITHTAQGLLRSRVEI